MNEQNKTMHGYINIPSKKKRVAYFFEDNIMQIYFNYTLPMEEKQNVTINIQSKNQWIIGNDIATGKSIIFFVEPTSFEDDKIIPFTQISIRVYFYIVVDCDLKYFAVNKVGFSFKELNSFFDLNRAIEREISEDNQYIIKTQPSNKVIKKFSFTVMEKKVKAEMAIKVLVNRDASQALRLESVLYCLFKTTYDMEFILDIYLTIKKLFYFLCYRQSIQINSIDLFRQDDKGRYLSAGKLFILFGNESIEDSKIIDKTIQYRLVQNHFEDLIKLIIDEKIYLEHIPIDYEASKHISNASFIMDTAAFEWTFKQCYDKIPMADYKNKIKNDVLNTLENLRTNNEYNSREKKIIKFYKNIIDRVEMKLAGKILYALKDLDGVLMEFIKWIYALNNMSLDEKKVYNEIAEDLEYQRNAYAHGNIDREMKPNIITDTVILEWLNYCMVLKMAGFNETEIFNIINVVFQRNHKERKCDI